MFWGDLWLCRKSEYKRKVGLVRIMSLDLLDKTRKINKLLHNNNSTKFVFSDICHVLAEILSSNVQVISRKGKLLGISNNLTGDIITEMLCENIGEYIDENLNERFLNVLSTKENVNLLTLGFSEKDINIYIAVISPIIIAGKRVGTLFIYRVYEQYEIDDIILSEYVVNVVGLEMVRALNEEYETASRKERDINLAISTLSTAELIGVRNIVSELKGMEECIIVTSNVAKKAGITRSVIVNALRKLESANVVETHSNGMKGTWIKVNNDLLYTYTV